MPSHEDTKAELWRNMIVAWFHSSEVYTTPSLNCADLIVKAYDERFADVEKVRWKVGNSAPDIGRLMLIDCGDDHYSITFDSRELPVKRWVLFDDVLKLIGE